MAIIYLVQSTLDKTKIYIGKTDRSLAERRKEHEDKAANHSSTKFHCELLRKGLDNWEWRILETLDPAANVFEREKYWMQKFDALPIDLLNTASTNSNTETKRKKADTLARAVGGKNVWKSASAKKWMILSGKLKPLENTETKIKYEGLLDAERKTGETRGAIKKSCDTGIPTSRGKLYAWLDIKGNLKLTENHIKKVPRLKRVKNKTTGEIYNSLADAAKNIGVSMNIIRDACNGKYKTTKGQIVCFLDDNGNEVLTETHKNTLLRLEEKKKIGFVAWRIEDKNRSKPYIFDSILELINSIKRDSGEELSQSHILDICKGKRQHDQGWRVAYYDKEKKEPIFRNKHLLPIREKIRGVICLNDNKVFSNATEAGKFYNLESGQILLCCAGKLKSTGRNLKTKYKFAHTDKEGKPILTPLHSESDSWLGKKIFCPGLGKEFRSVAEFCRETNIPAKRVSKYLKGKNIDLGGLTLVQV